MYFRRNFFNSVSICGRSHYSWPRVSSFNHLFLSSHRKMGGKRPQFLSKIQQIGSKTPYKNELRKENGQDCVFFTYARSLLQVNCLATNLIHKKIGSQTEKKTLGKTATNRDKPTKLGEVGKKTTSSNTHTTYSRGCYWWARFQLLISLWIGIESIWRLWARSKAMAIYRKHT